MILPQRKNTRLKNYNYSLPGAYFITVCTKDRKEVLSKIIVGTGVLDCPQNVLTPYGIIAEKYINQMNEFYENISVDKYVIMPNHIHFLIRILPCNGGPPGRSVPTNSVIGKFVGTFKRFCNKEYGNNIWQSRSYDHIIRNETDYREIWNYIDTNVLKWDKDCFCKKEEL